MESLLVIYRRAALGYVTRIAPSTSVERIPSERTSFLEPIVTGSKALEMNSELLWWLISSVSLAGP